MNQFIFSSDRAEKLYDEIASAAGDLEFVNHIQKITDQVCDVNHLSPKDHFGLRRVSTLELYSLADLGRLHRALRKLVTRAKSDGMHRRPSLISRIDRFIDMADRMFNTDGSSIVDEIPFKSCSGIFAGLSLRLDLVGGSLVRVIVTFRPAEILANFFQDVSILQIDTLLDIHLKWAHTPWTSLKVSADKGNDRKLRLIQETDEEIIRNIAYFFAQDFCEGIYSENFGGTPILQSFFYDEHRLAKSCYRSSDKPVSRSAFFQILAQSCIGFDYKSFTNNDGTYIIEQGPRSTSDRIVISKLVGDTTRHASVEPDILSLIGEKSRLWLHLSRLTEIERQYIKMTGKRKTLNLRRERLEIYNLKTTHGLISSASDKIDKLAMRLNRGNPLEEFIFDYREEPLGFHSYSKNLIRSLRKELESKLSYALDDSSVVRDEADAGFQRNAQCFAIVIALIALFAPFFQVYIERRLADCFSIRPQCPVSYTLCWWLLPLR